MRVALKAANGLYVCAEEGGGSVVRANRDAIGPWETFEFTRNPNAPERVSLKTSGGFYLCAEEGGGGTLSANRLEVGPWETFTFKRGTFLANDQTHYICAEVGSPDPILNVTRTAIGPWETFEMVLLEKPVVPVVPTTDRTVLRGSFCIPTYPRVWWPAALAVTEAELDRYIAETLARHYTFAQVLVSGWPYASDYPHIDPNAGELARVLTKCKQAGLNTVVAFDDQQGSDLSYLKPVLVPNRPLIDWCMGIYEINGVLKDPELVLSVLKQSRALLPDAYLAVHFTPVDEGNESYGHVDWHRAKNEANLQCFFFQTAGWVVGVDEAVARLQDYTRRLGGPGFHGYPTLECGVNDYENTTSLTYRGQMSEADAVEFTDSMMQAPQEPDEGVYSVPPTGFADNGTA